MSIVERHDIWTAVWNGLRRKDVATLKKHGSPSGAAVAADTRELLLFRRGDAVYAAPLENLRQIRTQSRFCRVPGAVSVVPGVIYHQGQILGVHDLAAFLGRPAADPGEAWVLIIEDGADRLGLLADDVLDIRQLPKSACSQAPPALGPKADCFSGALSDGTLVLRPAQLFATPAFGHAR